MSGAIEGWHFTGTESAGEALKVTSASADILEAIERAPGPYLWRVRIDGAERTALWGFDATSALQKFARRCALDVAHLWDMPAIVRQYLETGDEDLRANAWTAVWAAAWAAEPAPWDASDAASEAAWAASYAFMAAGDASAARAAVTVARAAAWAAGTAGGVGAAAWDAARAAQRKALLTMIEEAAA